MSPRSSARRSGARGSTRRSCWAAGCSSRRRRRRSRSGRSTRTRWPGPGSARRWAPAPPEDRIALVSTTAPGTGVARHRSRGQRASWSAILGPGGGEIARIAKAGWLGLEGTAGSGPAITGVAGYEQIDRHADLTGGRWAEAGRQPMEATLPEAVAAALGIGRGRRPGARRHRGPHDGLAVTVVGLWRARADDPYWQGIGGDEVRSTASGRAPVADPARRRDQHRRPPAPGRVAGRPRAGPRDDRRRDQPARRTSRTSGPGSPPPSPGRRSRSGRRCRSCSPTTVRAASATLIGRAGRDRRVRDHGGLRAGPRRRPPDRAPAGPLGADRGARRGLGAPRRARAGRGDPADGADGRSWRRSSRWRSPSWSPGSGRWTAWGWGRTSCSPRPRSWCRRSRRSSARWASRSRPCVAQGDPSQARARAGRQAAATIAQRAGLDVALVIVAGLGLWQFQQHGAAVVGGLRGSTGLDPAIVVVPAIGLLAGGLLVTRLLPRAAALLELAIPTPERPRARPRVAPAGSPAAALHPVRPAAGPRGRPRGILGGLRGHLVALAGGPGRLPGRGGRPGRGLGRGPPARRRHRVPLLGAHRRRRGGRAGAPDDGRRGPGDRRRRRSSPSTRRRPSGSWARLRPPDDPGWAALASGLVERRPEAGIALDPATRRLSLVVDSALAADATNPRPGAGPARPPGRSCASALVIDGLGTVTRVPGEAGTMVGTGQRLEIPLEVAAGGQSLTLVAPVRLLGVELDDAGARRRRRPPATFASAASRPAPPRSGDDWTPVRGALGRRLGDGRRSRARSPATTLPPRRPGPAPLGRRGRPLPLVLGPAVSPRSASGCGPSRSCPRDLPVLASRAFLDTLGARVGDRSPRRC